MDARDAEGHLLPDVDRLTAGRKSLCPTSLDELLYPENVLVTHEAFVGPVHKMAHSGSVGAMQWC